MVRPRHFAMKEPTSLGVMIRFHRHRLMWTQADLASRSGVSARTISDLERGLHATARMSTIGRLAEALQLTAIEVQRMMSFVQQASSRCSPSAAPTADGSASEVAALAGDWASAAVAHASALESLLTSGHADDGALCDAYLGLGRAATLAVQRHEARPAFLSAARLAMRLGDRERLVRAAAGYAFMTKAGDPGVGADELWRAAQMWVVDRDIAGRSVLTAARACALALELHVEKAVDYAEHALLLARRCNDPDALAVALSVLLLATRGYPNAARRLELAEEMCLVADSTLDHVLLAGIECCAVPALELGDRERFAVATDLLAHHGHLERHPFATAQAVVWAATAALLDGDLDVAARLSAEGQSLSGGAPNFTDGHVAQLFSIARAAGRNGELYQAIADRATTDPTEPAWRAAYLVTAAVVGDASAVASGLDRLCTEMWPLPRSRTYPVVLAFVAEAAFLVGNRHVGAMMATELMEYEGSCVVVATGTSCEGPADHYLAMALSAAGERSAAVARARSAAAQAEVLGAPLLVERTEQLLARIG